MKRSLVACLTVAGTLLCGDADGAIRITEWMYAGASPEFVELTNVGASPIDMTGWSYDDDSANPGVFDLSGFGLVAPGESVVLTEGEPAAFRTEWSLSNTIKVLGPYTNNLGRADAIHIFDSNAVLIDRLEYGDQVFPGTVRTQNKSGIPATLAALGADDVTLWKEAVAGDAHGSNPSAALDVGNPGRFILIPEPSSIAFATVAGLLLLRCRQAR
jgi:predicted extracellular nuclease